MKRITTASLLAVLVAGSAQAALIPELAPARADAETPYVETAQFDLDAFWSRISSRDWYDDDDWDDDDWGDDDWDDDDWDDDDDDDDDD